MLFRSAKEYLSWWKFNFVLSLLAFALSLIFFSVIWNKLPSPFIAIGLLSLSSALVVSTAFAFKKSAEINNIFKIQTASCELKRIFCSNIKFVLQPNKFDISIIGIIFTDTDGKNYCYICPHSLYDNRKWPYAERKHIRKNIKSNYINKSVIFMCYCNTNLIKNFCA